MKQLLKILIIGMLCCYQTTNAQQSSGDVIIGNVSAKNDGTLIGVSIREVDATNRIVSATITDINGNFSLKVRNPQNKLQVNYVGYKPVTLAIGSRKKFSIEMIDATEISVVEVRAKKMSSTGSLNIPERENSLAMQTLKADFDNLSVASIDEALQGQIAGLDVVSNSGDVGSGSTMRLRGTATINGNATPLIVVNDIIFDAPNTDSFDFVNANNESFANLLSINVSDIESVTVMKDGASSAQWGSRGANGVISIRTKKGFRGKPRITYSYRLSEKTQPQGYKMLNGDQYTMMLKEAYFNPKFSSTASNIKELNYIQNDAVFPDWRMYDNNTDWIGAVETTGITNDHYITLAGGGEKATFYLSGGYYNETGSIIGQNLDRYTSRMQLDYNVSDRILFTSEMAFTYSNEDKNYTYNNMGVLAIAYQKMPNLGIYREDSQGNPTNEYYNVPQTMSGALNDQKGLPNPVELANLAKNNVKSYRLIPTFRLQYDILPRETHQMLQIKGLVNFDISSNTSFAFLPKELFTTTWTSDQLNKSDFGSSKSSSATGRLEIQWMPNFSNNDHSLLMYASSEINGGSSISQSESSYGLPQGISSPTTGSYVSNMGSGTSVWKGLSFNAGAHYSYQSKYNVDFSFRREGSSKFGPSKRFGNFGGLALRWNVIDEAFMKPYEDWLSMLAVRTSAGVTGNAPTADYLYFSRYESWSNYNQGGTIRPVAITLDNLQWETVSDKNLGLDLGVFKDLFEVHFNYYYKRTDNLLQSNVPVPTSSGYPTLTYQNVGSMSNQGWELNLNANKFIKAGKFSVDCYLNFSNNMNTILDLSENVLKGYNGEYDFKNGSYMSRLAIGNPIGSIYGFKYKGVYQYDIDNSTLVASGYTKGTAPIARNAAGNIIYNSEGKPVPMYFAYGTTNQKQFKGGDAMYEDINHDGNINQLDIVYLGNSNPKVNGGFGLKFNYDRLTVNIYSVFRYGNKVINMARLNAENMSSNLNQSSSVNWRWRKNGDVTSMPRALFGGDAVGMNSLGSDRYVEDGSFWRVNQMSVNYALPTKLLSRFSINQLSVFFTLYNLFVFTNYSGVDPEVGYGSFGVSTDNNQTPRTRSFTTGATISF
jgi:TonB-linked SusC/RagA family outer membrane protein